jgi:hypothetical protein
MGPSRASVWTRTNSTGIAGLLSFLACVSNGSPPPGPSPEASSESRALEPAAAPTQPAPTSPRASPSPGSNSPATPAELRRELSALPENVLAGTDVVPLADHLASAVPIPQSGAFRSEQGGATAEVRIMTGPQEVTLAREFTEPGTKTQTKRYDGLQARANGVRLSSANLEVLGMRQSLLPHTSRAPPRGLPPLGTRAEPPKVMGCGGGALSFVQQRSSAGGMLVRPHHPRWLTWRPARALPPRRHPTGQR